MQPEHHVRSKVNRSAVWFVSVLLGLATLRSIAEDPARSAQAEAPVPASSAPEQGQEQATTDPNGLPSDTQVGVLHYFKGGANNPEEFTQSGLFPKAGENGNQEFFHRPVCAVHSIEVDPAPTPGKKYARVRLALSAPEIREAAANVIVKQWGIQPRVAAWPITGEMIYVLKTRTEQPVAKAIRTVGSREQIEFVVEVSDQVAATIQQHPELFLADVYFATRLLNYAKGTLSIKGTQNIIMALRDTFQSRDPSLEDKDLAGHLLIGDEIGELERRLAVLVERTFEADHPAALPILREQVPVLVDRIVARLGDDGMNYDTLIAQMGRRDVEAALSLYLAPRIKQLNDNRTGDHYELKMDEAGKVENEGGGITVVTPIIGGTNASETTKRHLARLEQGTDLTWQLAETEGVFRPHSLRVARVRKGLDLMKIDEQTIAYVPLAPSGGYMIAANVPLDFTLDRAVTSLRDQNLLDVIDHGIGTLYLSFSDQPPGPNWVAADGVALFSNSPQTPPHLRGKPVPDLRNSLLAVGDHASLGDIGRRVEGTLDPQVIDASKILSLPDTVEKWIVDITGNAFTPRWNGPQVVVFTANEDYRDVKFNTARWNSFGGTCELYPARFKYHPKGTPVVGEVTIQPPTRTYVRAFVRIR